ncbi:glycosyltransferase [Arthrobacter sp. StoSoilB20]|uniref:glycosyltransferase n=1 Tax=Arthrobacter sp. StoSoilB20 TaxID=2830995 RepID=UPI001CC622C5|nr:glycosyltransferase [Arthrobacter sp. StoSoilB20]
MTLTNPTTSAPPRRFHSARFGGGALPASQPELLNVRPENPQLPRRSPVDTGAGVPVLDLTVPVFNEEAHLEKNLRTLHGHLSGTFPHTFRITVADNSSTDSTLRIAERLARELPELRVVRFQERGRGNALRRLWQSSPSPVLAYMEADLSTDLSALAPLLAPLLSGHSDLAVGTRLAPDSRVVRSGGREFTSRSYNALLRTVLGTRISDAQCGFKAVRADVAHLLLPHTKDDGWFFDTELLVIAERCGLRIHEVPVDWTDDPNSSVDVVRTALADLRGMARLTRDLRPGRFPVRELRLGRDRTAPGTGLAGRVLGAVAWTSLYALFFVLLRSVVDPLPANFIALALMASTTRLRIQGPVMLLLTTLLSTAALAILPVMTTADRWLEGAVLAAAGLAGHIGGYVAGRRRLAPDVT